MTSVPDKPHYTVAIYQDPLQVEGVLQQMRGALLTDASVVDDRNTSQTDGSDVTGRGGVGAELKVPALGSIQASAELKAGDSTQYATKAGLQATRNFKYTSAFYLHEVRNGLRTSGLLKTIDGPSAVGGLRPGDFVEFQASFSPDEIIALLDVFNPQLIGGLTKWLRRKSFIEEAVSAVSDDERQQAVLQYQTIPDADAEFAQAVAEAVRVDFRSAATREYFGTIANCPDVTAVTVCETQHFLVDDADRILDGHFSVLGKLSTPPTADVPILSRNKVLDRIQPAALDYAMQWLQDLAKQRIETSEAVPFGNDQTVQQVAGTLDEYLDLSFPSRIDGDSFKVIPMAIFL